MKYLILMSLLMITSCASHHKIGQSEVKEYASYQFNCHMNEIELKKISNYSYEAKGCGDEANFKVMCSLGPCYTIRFQ